MSLRREQGDRDSTTKPEGATEKMKNDSNHVHGGASSKSNELAVDENNQYIALTGQDFSSMTADSFCVFKACDGKMFRLEKKTILQSSVGCDTFCGVETSEKNIKGPYVLEFCADVLEAAFNFLRGYSWSRIDLPTILGVWKFGHHFELKEIEADAQMDAILLALQKKDKIDPPLLVKIARTAREVSANDVARLMDERYVASRWSTSSCFELAGKEFAGFDQHDGERIACSVIAEEKNSIRRCGISCYLRTINGTCQVTDSSSKIPRQIAVNCRFPARSVQLLHAIVAWIEGEGDAEPGEKLRIAKDLCQKMNRQDIMERDLSAMFEAVHGASPETMELVANLRIEAHNRDLATANFARCDHHF